MSKEELDATPPLDQHLAMVLEIILEGKEARGVSPVAADMQEILAIINKDVNEALDRMVKSGLLTSHRTLNSVSYEFTPPK